MFNREPLKYKPFDLEAATETNQISFTQRALLWNGFFKAYRFSFCSALNNKRQEMFPVSQGLFYSMVT